MDHGYKAQAKAYILYRAEHAQTRHVPTHVRQAFDESDVYFKTPIQKYQFYDKYSRYNYSLGRRETWIETVDRAVDYMHHLAGDRLERDVYERIRLGIRNMQVMPSMRLLAMAGPAAIRNPVSIYNCSYMVVTNLDAFVEALYISMSGCGVGYSVERENTDKLPTIHPQRYDQPASLHVVEDTCEGWCNALRYGLYEWVQGYDVQFDLSNIRPAGTPLKIKGGRASGPLPLKNLLTYARRLLLSRQGSKLTSIDAHDLMCVVGDCAVSGGVRRTALISLFDLDDRLMLSAKAPGFEIDHPYRYNANNSAVWKRRYNQKEVLDFMHMMYTNGTSEPGIFNRLAANATRPTRRAAGNFGTNPCGEISLLPNQLCNLSSAICRDIDTIGSLRDKVELASIIGTIQSLATDFTYLSDEWRVNGEEERLLGVDLNGQLDSPVAREMAVQNAMKQVAVHTNHIFARHLGINQSAAVTCVKPNGNSSTLVNCASGLHARWSQYYIRRVRVAATSPIYKVLHDAGVPMTPENGQLADTATTWVLAFPIKAPEDAILGTNLTALNQLDYWLQVKNNYTEHNPSCTVNYKADEVIDIARWIYINQERVAGITFSPLFETYYAQMPYEEIDEETYNIMADQFPPVDFSKIWKYESGDLTTASQELACTSGTCEVTFG